MTRLAFVDVEELNREIVSFGDYETVKSVLLVNKTLSRLVDDSLWYRMIERLLGESIGRLKRCPIRLVYLLLTKGVREWDETRWIFWRDEPALYDLLKRKMVISELETFNYSIAVLTNGHEDVKAMIDTNSATFKDLMEKYYSEVHYEPLERYLEVWKSAFDSTGALRGAWKTECFFLIPWLVDHGADVVAASTCPAPALYPMYERYIAYIATLDDKRKHWRDRILLTTIGDFSSQRFNLLLRYGATPSYNNYNAIKIALRKNNDKLDRLIILSGIKAIHFDQQYVLRYAVNYRHYDFLDWLLKHYAHQLDVNAANGYALCTAVRAGHMKIVQLLLKHGADVSLRNFRALFHGAKSANPLIIDVLLADRHQWVTTPNWFSFLVPIAQRGNIDTAKPFIWCSDIRSDLRSSGAIDRLCYIARRANQSKFEIWLENQCHRA